MKPTDYQTVLINGYLEVSQIRQAFSELVSLTDSEEAKTTYRAWSNLEDQLWEIMPASIKNADPSLIDDPDRKKAAYDTATKAICEFDPENGPKVPR